jgi:uncharacterized oxidoreductase
VTSHGIIRLPQYVKAVHEGKVAPGAALTVRHETPATAVLDGNHGFGQVMARMAMEHALGLADSTGIGAVTLVNCSHTGRLGSYTEYAAGQGKVGLMMVNAGGHGQLVAPFGGRAARLATNPLSIAIPSGGPFPLVLDMATSIAPEGRVRALRTAGKLLPEGWVVTAAGQPTTNPADLYGPPRGALLPFGGHKGFGLAMIVDALAGGLSGAGCCSSTEAPLDGRTDGVFLLAIRVDAFVPLDLFGRQIEQLIRHVKDSPPAAGVQAVLVPGELEAQERARRLREGIPVSDGIWQLIRDLLQRLGIAAPL